MTALPKGWIEAELRELADTQLGKMLDKAKRVEGMPLPYLRNINVRWGKFDTDDLLQMPFRENELEKFSIRDGDILICEGGEPGRAAVWTSGKTEIKFQKALHRVRMRGGIDPCWLAHYLRLEADRGRLSDYFTGTTIKHLTGEALARLRVPLPPLPEQRRIVAKIDALLERAERAREALEAIPPLLDRTRQSLLTAAFRGELTVVVGSLPDTPHLRPSSQIRPPKSEFEPPLHLRIPQRWEWVPLWTLAAPELNAFTDGPFGSKLKSEHYVDEGVRVIRLGNLGIGEFKDDDRSFITPAHFSDLARHSVFEGDLLIAALADPVGRCCQVPQGIGPAIVKADCIRFKAGQAVFPRYLMHWLNSPAGRKLAEERSHGIGRLRINMDDLKGLPVPLASLDEQAGLVSEIDALMYRISSIYDFVRSQLAQLSTLTQSILAKAFRGELVPQDPTDEPASVLLARIRAERAAQAAAPKKKAGRAAVRPKTQPKEEKGMPKTRKEVPADHLRTIVASQPGKSLKAAELFRLSDMGLDEFYKQLATEMKPGGLRHGTDKETLELADAA